MLNVPPAALTVLEKLAAHHQRPVSLDLLHLPVPFGFLTLEDHKALAQIGGR